MDESPQRCPKCGGQMEQGFITDRVHQTSTISHWVAGVPRRSPWGGMKLPHDKRLPILTFRCTSCGYLESYAQ